MKALEFEYICDICTRFASEKLLLLSNFSSLVHIFATDVKNQATAMQDIISSCKMFKHLKCTSNSFDSSHSLVVNCNIEQLYIELPFTTIQNAFMESILAHGGLVHVFFCFYSVTEDSINSIIDNSPKLLTCQIYAQLFLYSTGILLKLLEFKMTLRKIFW